ncbi:MAG: DNA-binding protein WhiA [Clostridium sp.]|jgi:DNA-binding protein WhiA|nr:DNA-binding protein WhiA [Clostridium sp.]MBQ5420647.1 DNA-binding protein WhiA [Clostridium sp.]HAE80379.1 DNA-binding protein WhiA [Lachnoclostridium sp.]
MSFSSRVKEELSRRIPDARHCRIAEISAILGMCGTVGIHEDSYHIRIYTENVTVARKLFLLLKETFGIRGEILIRQSHTPGRSRAYVVLIRDAENVKRILEACKMIDRDGEIGENYSTVRTYILRQDCCRRAFIRGAFLASGSMSDPDRFYHLELVCQNEERAMQLQSILATFGLDAKTVVRKKYYVVYIKEGNQIVELLGLMGADSALMELENIRIVKEMRNSVNRKVNCETANLNKTVSAALRQVADIEYIRDTKGLDFLSPQLEEMARVRLEAPEASLLELGSMLETPVGKSGVNHRLRKISEIADALRGGRN